MDAYSDEMMYFVIVEMLSASMTRVNFSTPVLDGT